MTRWSSYTYISSYIYKSNYQKWYSLSNVLLFLTKLSYVLSVTLDLISQFLILEYSNNSQIVKSYFCTSILKLVGIVYISKQQALCFLTQISLKGIFPIPTGQKDWYYNQKLQFISRGLWQVLNSPIFDKKICFIYISKDTQSTVILSRNSQ